MKPRVQYSGRDGKALIALAVAVLKRAGGYKFKVTPMLDELPGTSDYDAVLQVVSRYVDVVGEAQTAPAPEPVRPAPQRPPAPAPRAPAPAVRKRGLEETDLLF